jgi:hypothetical protein
MTCNWKAIGSNKMMPFILKRLLRGVRRWAWSQERRNSVDRNMCSSKALPCLVKTTNSLKIKSWRKCLLLPRGKGVTSILCDPRPYLKLRRRKRTRMLSPLTLRMLDHHLLQWRRKKLSYSRGGRRRCSSSGVKHTWASSFKASIIYSHRYIFLDRSWPLSERNLRTSWMSPSWRRGQPRNAGG